MNEVEALRQIEGDLQTSTTQQVLYVEGKTDIPALFALLGVEEPMDRLHQGVYISSRNSGSAVKIYVELAKRESYHNVYGVIDGDGLDLLETSAHFDQPFGGPVYTWKAYCIENLLVQTSWPDSWGATPDWEEVLLRYTAYVGLNRIHADLQGRLETLRLEKFQSPAPGRAFFDQNEILEALQRDKHLLEGIDVAAIFTSHCGDWEDTVNRSLQEAHTQMNGKWLFKHFAPEHLGKTEPLCRKEWLEAVRASGGHPEVKELWKRLFGQTP